MKTFWFWLRSVYGLSGLDFGWILIFGICLVGCGPTPGQSGDFSSVQLEASKAKVYGAADGPGALTAAFDVAVSPQGRILVSEPSLAEIAVFDAQGAFLQTIGRRGEGPGEFQTPGAIRFKGDTLTVLDFMSGINLFTVDGEFIDRVSFTLPTPPELGFPTRPALLLADGSVACFAPLRSMLIVSGEVTHESWVKADRSGALVDTLVKYPVDGRYSSFRLPEGPPYVGPPATPWDDILGMPPDGSLLVMVNRTAALSGTEPVVELFRIDLSGDTVHSRSIRYDPVPLTTDWRDSVAYSWAQKEADRRNLTADRLAGIYLEGMDWPAHHPAVSAVVVGGDGTIWMRREIPIGDSIRWDLVDSDFEPVGFTFLPMDFTVKRVSRSAAWGVERDEYDVPSVVRYDVNGAG